MSILLTLVTLLLFIAISYVRSAKREALVARQLAPPGGLPAPRFVRDAFAEIPQGYRFHPGHTWVLAENSDRARIGVDSLAANLLGKVDRIELPGLNRWVRQGQRICKVTASGVTVDLISPVEGIVMAVNTHLLQDPSLLSKDPYGEGWILQVQSPDLAINLKNLLQESFAPTWMRNAITRVLAMTSGFVPALAQDGGLPAPGLLTRLDTRLQRELISEFFLS